MSLSSSRPLSLGCLLAIFSMAAGACAQTGQPPAQPAAGQAGQKSADAGTPDRAEAYFHYMLAHEYEEMASTFGRSEYATRAIEEYKMALNDDPSSKYLNSHLAELYFSTGRIRDAIVAAQNQIKQDPSDIDAHRLLARVYLRSLSDGQQPEISDQMLRLAIGEYQKIIQLEPGSADDHLMLARLYAADHQTAQAEAELAAAEKIDPGSEETALIANRFYTDLGDTKKAIQVLSSLPDDDQTARTEYQLGVTWDLVKDTKDAIAAFRKALDLEPDNLDVERALAHDLSATNQTADALTAWKDVAAGDPTDPNAWGEIAEIEQGNGQFDDALTAVKKARDLSSDDPKFQFQEAMIDDALGHLEDAQHILEQMASVMEQPTGQYTDQQRGNYALVLDHLAQVDREENRPDLAAAQYHKMETLGDAVAGQAYDEEVETWREAHDYDKAMAAARAAVDKLPKSVDAKLTLARQLADTGQVDQGIQMAKALIQSDPKNLAIYYQLAQIYTDLKKWKEAGQVLDAAEKQATRKDDQLTVTFERAMLLDRARRYNEAEADFRKVLAMDPNNALTLNNFGFMLADRGVQLDEALAMIRKAVKLEPTNYAYLDSLGWAYYRMGQYSQAETNLRQAISRGANDPTVHDHLGDVYEKTGRLRLAAAQWELALNQYAHTLQADMDTGDVSKVQKKLDSARVRLAKESNSLQPGKPD